MKLVSMLDEEMLLEKVPGSSREEIYSYMLNKLIAFNELDLSADSLLSEMIAHEDDAGILLPGLNMPHLRLNDLHDLFIVIGLPENPAAAGADMIFMSLIGDHMSDVYLKMLAGLGRHLTSTAAVEELLSAARGGKDALWSYLQNNNIQLRNVVTAEDVMTPVHLSLHPDSPLSDAFDCFHNTHLRFLPVVDDNGKLVGELSARKVVKSFIPDYIYMMDSVNFMNDFSVFNKIFDSEHSQPVSQYMHTEPARAALDTPLFQLTLLLTKQDGGAVYIVDAENTLQGIFAIENVIDKVLRG